MAKASRSQFIEKLHSLSSFIRQLSYYNFKHPSGFFVQGDASRLHGIVRKTRNRPEKTGIRRASSSSVQSNSVEEEQEPPPPMPQWPAMENRQLPSTSYGDDRRQSFPPHPTSFQPPFPSVRQMVVQDTPYRPFQQQSLPPHPWDSQPQNHERRPSDFGGALVSPRTTKRVELADLVRPSGQPHNLKSLQILPPPQNGDDTFRHPYPSPTFANYTERSPSGAVASGLPMAYDEGSASSSRPPYPPSSSYQGSFPAAGQPSPTGSSYSSGSDSHPSEHHQNQLPPFNPQLSANDHHREVVDPRNLSADARPIQQQQQPHQYFSQPPPPNWNPHRTTSDLFSTAYQPAPITSPRR
ncbi:hypothetical protein RQP46_005926 [Phenoliferia psychrophenolica]